MPKLPALPMNSKRANEDLKMTNGAAEKCNITATLETTLAFCISGGRRHVPTAGPPLTT
jgi:hypothetical protein